MEIRRLLLFVALSWLILLAYASVNKQLFPPPPVADQKAEPDAKVEPAPKAPDQNKQEQPQDQGQPANQPPEQPVKAPQQARQHHALGSLDPQSKSTIVVYFDNRWAAVKRVELVERKSNGRFKYRNLLKTSGYLGHLALSNETTGGCRINIVVPGSPAARATSTETPEKGLAIGDIITRIGKTSIKTKQEFLAKAEEAKPGDTLEIQVQRNSDGKTATLGFTATLTENPMELIAPTQQLSANSIANDGITPSFLLGLSKAGESNLTGTEREIASLPSLRKSN